MNGSIMTEFVLLGFPDLLYVRIVLFYVFLLLYILTLTGNFVIIATTSFSIDLHTPMYFFLGNLSFLEILYTSVTIPKTLLNFHLNKHSISFVACAVQMYFFISLGSVECSLLAIMAFDRYVAICDPLHYVTVMEPPTCVGLAFCSWISGFINSMVHTTCTFRHTFCSSNVINQFFCDIRAVLSLACGDTLPTEIVLFTVGGAYGVGSFILTVISYIHIICSILKMKSRKGQQKAFSTCASHLIVVSLFYGTSLFASLRQSAKQIMDQHQLAPVIYAVVTPTLNPLIYTMRNKEFRTALSKMIGRKQPKSQLRANCHYGCSPCFPKCTRISTVVMN